MFYQLIRPLLFQLDAETAHEVGLAGARFLADRRALANLCHQVTRYALPIKKAGLEFPNPVGLAAGMDKNARAPLAWWAFGFGFVELGTVTPRPQIGNPLPRMFRQVPQRSIVNRMGFNNDGAEAVAKRLADQYQRGVRPAFPIGISVGKNATTPLDQAPDDYAQATALLAPHADFITINVSSPNTAGLRSLQTRDSLLPILRATQAAAQNKPVLVKVAPELAGEDLAIVLETCLGEGAAGIIATNTLATHGQNGLPQGGLSGPPMHELAVRRVEEIRQHLGDEPLLIGCGGIHDVGSARRMMAAGADLIQLYTGLVYEGPLLPARLVRGVKNAHALVGRDNRKQAPVPPSAGR